MGEQPFVLIAPPIRIWIRMSHFSGHASSLSMLLLTLSRFVTSSHVYMRRKMPKPRPVSYYLKVFKTDGEVLSLTTKKSRRIFYRIQAVKNSEILKYLLRVTYSSITDNFGKKINPINEGVYTSVEDLKQAWHCFIEK